MAYDVITIGSAVRDIFLFLDEKDAPIFDNPKKDMAREKFLGLEFGAKLEARNSAICSGGGALNSGATFSRFGLKTGALISLGSDNSADVIEAIMRKEKISRKFVVRRKDAPTGFSVLLVAGKQKRDRVVISERGASDQVNFSINKSGITNTKWYYLTALAGATWKKELLDISSAAKKHKIKLAWNPGSIQIKAGISSLSRALSYCEVLILNRDEALELSRDKKNNIKNILNALLMVGPKKVIISDGINGVYYCDSKRSLHLSANESIKAKEPTGAGDALGSGFIAGLVLEKDVESSLRFGIANSESVVQKIGAQAGIMRKDALKNISSSKHVLSVL